MSRVVVGISLLVLLGSNPSGGMQRVESTTVEVIERSDDGATAADPEGWHLFVGAVPTPCNIYVRLYLANPPPPPFPPVVRIEIEVPDGLTPEGITEHVCAVLKNEGLYCIVGEDGSVVIPGDNLIGTYVDPTFGNLQFYDIQANVVTAIPATNNPLPIVYGF